RLTGGIAHDFNNLLHVVNMNLELVSLYAKEEKVKPVVDRAKSAARRGARLTNQLLSFARSQSLMPKVTRVNQLLLGMKDLLEISVGSGVEVEMDLCEEDATVVLDPSQLEMAVLNLAVNSKDAMPEGGKLRISTGTRFIDQDGDVPDGDYVLLCVKDSGSGIPANVLPKVFDPFFTTKPVGSGTGLGLSQVYGFARQSGGIARIHSVEGEGTTVEMLFPQADEEAEDEAAVRESAVPALAGACHILVVEDDPDVRLQGDRGRQRQRGADAAAGDQAGPAGRGLCDAGHDRGGGDFRSAQDDRRRPGDPGDRLRRHGRRRAPRRQAAPAAQALRHRAAWRRGQCDAGIG
ncbi:MAG: hybrid sensor histidine kinase/response regulator, partial [Ramlibacter sp.]|nr:hybrid sensor histidine kinase/response regulator [Ramlibacter sp.]